MDEDRQEDQVSRKVNQPGSIASLVNPIEAVPEGLEMSGKVSPKLQEDAIGILSDTGLLRLAEEWWAPDDSGRCSMVAEAEVRKSFGRALSSVTLTPERALGPRAVSGRMLHLGDVLRPLWASRAEAHPSAVWDVESGTASGGVPWADSLVFPGGASRALPSRWWSSSEPVPWRYTPGAEVPESMAAIFERALPDAEVRRYFLALVGRILSGDVLGRADPVVPLLLGVPASGKSTLIRMTSRLVGGSVELGNPSALSNRFATSRLVRTRLITFGDVKQGATAKGLDERAAQGWGLLNLLAEGDEVPVERKGGRAWSMALPAGLMLAGNHPPRFSAMAGDGLGRRLRVFRLDDPLDPSERNPHLLDEVEPGDWALAASACVGLWAAIRGDSGRIPALVRQWTEDALQAHLDPLQRFLREWEPGGLTPLPVIWDAFEAWAEDVGEEDRPSPSAMGRAIAEITSGATPVKRVYEPSGKRCNWYRIRRRVGR